MTRFMARNPVTIRISRLPAENEPEFVLVTYAVFQSPNLQEPIFSGQISMKVGSIEMDLSFLCSDLHEAAERKSYIIRASSDWHQEVMGVIDVYGGGISKAFQRFLKAKQSDIFSWKLKNSEVNFFLTTRTNSNVVFIPENELLPLAYYSERMNFEIGIAGEVVFTENGMIPSSRAVYFSPSDYRKKHFDSGKGIPSVFDVYGNGGNISTCIIVITEARPTDFYIDFKNTFGVIERIALYGVIEFTPEFTEKDDITAYDTVIEDFSRYPRRKEYVSKYTVEVGYKTRDERIFLLDMLASRECKFVANGRSYGAKVSASSPLLESTDGKPINVELTIELLDVENSFNPNDYEKVEFIPENALTDNFGNILTDNDGNILVSI